jgi:hypothetical protein
VALFPDTPDGIIEELRRQAVTAAEELDMPGLPVTEMLESEAADLLDRWQKGLLDIEAGRGGDPKTLARKLLTDHQSSIIGSAQQRQL